VRQDADLCQNSDREDHHARGGELGHNRQRQVQDTGMHCSIAFATLLALLDCSYSGRYRNVHASPSIETVTKNVRRGEPMKVDLDPANYTKEFAARASDLLI